MKTATRASVVVVALASLASSSADGAPASTPKERYEVDLTCSAVIAAAALDPSQSSRIEPERIRTLETYYARRVRSSGQEAGRSPDAIERDVDEERERIFPDVGTADATKAAAGRYERDEMVRNCAALPAFELAEGRPATAPAAR